MKFENYKTLKTIRSVTNGGRRANMRLLEKENIYCWTKWFFCEERELEHLIRHGMVPVKIVGNKILMVQWFSIKKGTMNLFLESVKSI